MVAFDPREHGSPRECSDSWSHRSTEVSSAQLHEVDSGPLLSLDAVLESAVGFRGVCSDPMCAHHEARRENIPQAFADATLPVVS